MLLPLHTLCKVAVASHEASMACVLWRAEGVECIGKRVRCRFQEELDFDRINSG